jgi:hypothetical protein
MSGSPPISGVGVRLDGWRLDLALQRLRAEVELGAGTEITTELAAHVAEHPLHEPLTCLLAGALYLSGRQADALDRLATLRKELADQLGVDPAPGTTDLEMRLLRQDPGLLAPKPPAAPRPRAARSSLPVPTTSLLGRGPELSALLAGLAAPGVVTLVGGPGSGKSRLAIEAATRVAAGERPVAFVELAPLRQHDAIEGTASRTWSRSAPRSTACRWASSWPPA